MMTRHAGGGEALGGEEKETCGAPTWEKAEGNDEESSDSEDCEEDMKTLALPQKKAIMELEKERGDEMRDAAKTGLSPLDAQGEIRFCSMIVFVDKETNTKNGDGAAMRELRAGGTRACEMLEKILPVLWEKSAKPKKMINVLRKDGAPSHAVRSHALQENKAFLPVMFFLFSLFRDPEISFCEHQVRTQETSSSPGHTGEMPGLQGPSVL